MKTLLTAPIPESVGLRADLYAQTRQLRLAMEKEVEKVKARETAIKDSIIRDLSNSNGDTGAAGQTYRAQLKTTEVPRVKDWESVYQYVSQWQRFDLLQKRLSNTAVMDMINDGQLVPGVETIYVHDVSITKV